MGIFEIGFAVGAVLLAALVGGVLYVLYPESFTGYSTPSNSNPMASSPYAGSSTPSTAGINSTASQNATSTSAGNFSSPQPSSNSGY